MKDESNDELHGAIALEFVEKHLREISNDSTNWKTEYVDDATGEHWVMDYPQGGQQGGGIPRLRKVSI
jgi:hypothetical protein